MAILVYHLCEAGDGVLAWYSPQRAPQSLPGVHSGTTACRGKWGDIRNDSRGSAGKAKGSVGIIAGSAMLSSLRSLAPSFAETFPEATLDGILQ